ncbi:MAG: hypothetical protein EP333_09330 [Bacteroidetes bacterium]|nr:MAG: hypothetical protein EP333_09330 [Bacteroidota bacterium]
MSIGEKYRITDTFSRGRKFGALYIGEDLSSGEKVIIKSLKFDSRDTTAVAQLLNEASFSFSIEGLPIVKDLYEYEQEIILVKKYVSGEELSAFWKRIKKKERLVFIIQLFQKLNILLEHLYQEEIYHLDLKPGNILIDGDVNDFSVNIIDFGLAIRKRSLPNRKILFPLGYAAPELILNKLKIVDRRTDIFSLGVTLYTLYSQELPLSHTNPSIFTNLQITHPIPQNSKIPKSIYPVLLKMTNKHQFKLPPNKYSETELIECLESGKEGRYNALNEVIEDLRKISEQPLPFYQRISFR